MGHCHRAPQAGQKTWNRLAAGLYGEKLKTVLCLGSSLYDLVLYPVMVTKERPVDPSADYTRRHIWCN
jgi:hypothetical protein